MDKEKLVKGLITNEATKFTEDDEKWLMSLEDDQLEKLAPQEIEEEPKKEPSKEASSPPEGEGEDKTPSTPEGEEEEVKEPTAEEYIAEAPEEIREVLNEGVTLQRAKREDLVKNLIKHPDNKFSEDALKAMSTNDLSNLSTLAHVEIDYSGRGGPRISEGASNEIPPAPKVFETKQAS